VNALIFRLSLVLAVAVLLRGADTQLTPPKPVTTPSPGYPAELTDTGISGQAVLTFVVKADGSVADPAVKSADQPAFGTAAAAAVANWKFEPGVRDGTPVDLKVTQQFRFQAPFEQQVNARFGRKVFTKVEEPVLDQKAYGKKPKVKKNVTPAYPRSLARSGVSEKVQVEFTVAPDGTTLNPKIVGDVKHKEFVMPAFEAVALTTYEPPVKDGKGVYVAANTTLRFEEPVQERGGGGGGRRGGGGGSRGGGGGGRGGF
jgi:TonB family protein